MIHFLKRKYGQVKRTIEFFPLIWNGGDFDYRYAVDLFTYQLTRTANYIEEKNRHTTALSDATRIRIAVNLLEKVYEEDYNMEYMDQIKSKYGKSNIEFVEIEELNKKGEPYYTMVERYEKDYTETELLEIEKERKDLMNLSRKKQEKAHKLAWNLIEHNIRGWWD